MPAHGRVIEVDLDRLAGWVARFRDRHGPVGIALADSSRVDLVADDGARAEIAVPHSPLLLPPAQDPAGLVAALVEHGERPRTVGVLLVRRGGWAVGLVTNGDLAASATGGGYVQGTTKAGGWSQQRYARRRGNQTQQVWQRAADGAVEVLLPRRADLDALVTGGDRTGVTAVLADPRLTGIASLVEPRFFPVGDPKRSVLDDVVRRLRTVAITLNDKA